MVDVLKIWKHNWDYYWDRLFFFAWYLYASRVERLHPMNCGFWTVRRRRDRRAGFPIEGFLPFWWGRLRSAFTRTRGIVQLFFQLEEVWLRSRPKSAIEDALHELVRKAKQDITDWRGLKAKELVALYEKLHAEMPEVKIPSVLSLWFRKRNPFAAAYTRAYVQRIWKQWYLHVWNPLKWAEVWLFETVNGVRFITYLMLVGR
jgi:hypothetical protein